MDRREPAVGSLLGRRRWTLWGLTGGVLVALGCSSTRSSPQVASKVGEGRRIEFDFFGPDAVNVSSATTQGRMTVVAFGTTYNLATQGLAEQLDELVRRYVPRINVVMVILEPPKHVLFAQAFAQSLKLSYPVVMSDYATLAGGGPFGRIDVVPAAFVLDRRGRLMWQAQGPFPFSELEESLAEGAG